MTVEQPTEREVIEAIIERRMRNVHTSMPGEIVSYNELKQTAEVKLSVHLQQPDGEYKAVEPLDEVPICIMRGGGFADTFALTSGDHVMVTFTEEDPSNWYFTGQAAPPEMRRRFGMYAFATPCLAPLPGVLPPTQYDSSGPVRANAAGFGQKWTGSVVEIGNLVTMGVSGEFIAMATKVLTELTTMAAAFNSHTHITTATVSTGPPGVLAPPVAQQTPGSVASSHVKVT